MKKLLHKFGFVKENISIQVDNQSVIHQWKVWTFIQYLNILIWSII